MINLIKDLLYTLKSILYISTIYKNPGFKPSLLMKFFKYKYSKKNEIKFKFNNNDSYKVFKSMINMDNNINILRDVNEFRVKITLIKNISYDDLIYKALCSQLS